MGIMSILEAIIEKMEHAIKKAESMRLSSATVK
jgi:hypothetical protein